MWVDSTKSTVHYIFLDIGEDEKIDKPKEAMTEGDRLQKLQQLQRLQELLQSLSNLNRLQKLKAEQEEIAMKALSNLLSYVLDFVILGFFTGA